MGKKGGESGVLAMEAEGTEMNARVKDLWPFLSQESRCAVSAASTIATEAHIHVHTLSLEADSLES